MSRIDSVAARSYRAWLIDLDGTLYYALPVRGVMAVALLMGHWRTIRTIKRFRQEQEALRSGAIAPFEKGPYELQLRRTAASLGIGIDAVRSAIQRWMFDAPGPWIRLFRRRRLIMSIKRYRDQGGQTALVSDYPAGQKLRSMGLVDLFDVVVASGDPNGPSRLKPDPEGLLLAAERLDVSPTDCLAIGDRRDIDSLAAHRAGMAFADPRMHGVSWPGNQAPSIRQPC